MHEPQDAPILGKDALEETCNLDPGSDRMMQVVSLA